MTKYLLHILIFKNRILSYFEIYIHFSVQHVVRYAYSTPNNFQ